MSAARLAKCAADGARNVLGTPDFEALRELRRRFARGGLPAAAERSPEDDARITAYRTISELLRVLEDFRARVARGEAVRLVMPEQTSERGRMRIEIAIEERPT